MVILPMVLFYNLVWLFSTEYFLRNVNCVSFLRIQIGSVIIKMGSVGIIYLTYK